MGLSDQHFLFVHYFDIFYLFFLAVISAEAVFYPVAFCWAQLPLILQIPFPALSIFFIILPCNFRLHSFIRPSFLPFFFHSIDSSSCAVIGHTGRGSFTEFNSSHNIHSPAALLIDFLLYGVPISPLHFLHPLPHIHPSSAIIQLDFRLPLAYLFISFLFVCVLPIVGATNSDKI